MLSQCYLSILFFKPVLVKVGEIRIVVLEIVRRLADYLENVLFVDSYALGCIDYFIAFQRFSVLELHGLQILALLNGCALRCN